MRQKNQVMLNLRTGAAGEARSAARPKSVRRKPALNARRLLGRRRDAERACAARCLRYLDAPYRPIPAKTVPEFIAYTKANPGKVSMRRASGRRPMWPASFSR
jgi:hypothetical protein